MVELTPLTIQLAPLVPARLQVAESISGPPARARRANTGKKIAMIDPVTLVGMAPRDISRILGKPTDTRVEAMTTEWIYGTPSCSLAIFFYPDIATGALRALKYNINGSAQNAEDDHDCAERFLLARGDGHG